MSDDDDDAKPLTNVLSLTSTAGVGANGTRDAGLTGSRVTCMSDSNPFSCCGGTSSGFSPTPGTSAVGAEKNVCTLTIARRSCGMVTRV